jgi:hypothetical protein
MKYFLFLFIVLLFVGCNKKSTTPTEQNNPKIGESFTMKAGETIAIQGEQLSFRFDSVLNDSRCPEGGVCVWAGDAAVLLTFPDVRDTMNTYLDPKEITHGNYKVTFQMLTPYPKTDQITIPQNLYNAQFIVSKI